MDSNTLLSGPVIMNAGAASNSCDINHNFVFININISFAIMSHYFGFQVDSVSAVDFSSRSGRIGNFCSLPRSLFAISKVFFEFLATEFI